ncbi:MAG: hypothetical protein PHE88_11960 [Elusimicrobia bacterium]|nr:hypothetical protein [Elusimicrobiota bacterium]
MKRYFVVLLLMFMVCSTNAFAVFGFTEDINHAYDAIYQAFVKNEMVVQTKIMLQNYNQSKQYYEDVKSMSEHKGGIGGYYAEQIKNDIDRANANTYSRLQNYMNSDPDDTAYVRKWVTGANTYLTNKTDYSKEIDAIGKKRDEDLKKLTEKSKKTKMTDEDQNIYNKERDLLLLRYLSGIDKGIKSLLEERTEQKQQDAARQLEWLRNEENSAKNIKANNAQLYNQRPKKDVYQILKEVPK